MIAAVTYHDAQNASAKTFYLSSDDDPEASFSPVSTMSNRIQFGPKAPYPSRDIQSRRNFFKLFSNLLEECVAHVADNWVGLQGALPQIKHAVNLAVAVNDDMKSEPPAITNIPELAGACGVSSDARPELKLVKDCLCTAADVYGTHLVNGLLVMVDDGWKTYIIRDYVMGKRAEREAMHYRREAERLINGHGHGQDGDEKADVLE